MLEALIFVIIILLFVCFVKAVFNLVRALYLRTSFLVKLNKICKQKGYTISYPRSVFASFIKTGKKPDIIVKTNDVTYLIRMITCRARKRIYYFVNAEYLVRVFRVFMAPPGSQRHDPIDISKKYFRFVPFDKKYSDNEENVTRVMLFNPSPFEINYIDEEGEKKVAGNLAVIHGWAIHNANGFMEEIK